MSSGILAGAGIAPIALRKWRFRAPVPTFGPNLLVNGDMESGDPPTDWVAGSNTQLASVADARPGSAGTKALRITASGSTTNAGATRTFSAAIGDWIRITGWYKQVTNNNGSTASPYTFTHNQFTGGDKTIAGWQSVQPYTGRLTALPSSIFISARQTPAGVGYYAYWDDVAVNKIDVASMFSTRPVHGQNVTVAATVARPLYSLAGNTLTSPVQAGVVSRLDDPANPMNFVIAYFWSGINRIWMDKCVNGIYTNLIADTTQRAIGSRISLAWSGNVATIYCNGVQVGTPQTIADASIVSNVHHGLFSTHESNKFFQFRVT